MKLHSIRLHVENGKQTEVSELLRIARVSPEESTVALRDASGVFARFQAQEAIFGDGRRFTPPLEIDSAAVISVPHWALAAVFDIEEAPHRADVTIWKAAGRDCGACWETGPCV